MTATQRLTCPAPEGVAVGVAVVGGSAGVDGSAGADEVIGVDGSGSGGVGVAVGEVAEAVGVVPVWLVVALVGGCVGEAVCVGDPLCDSVRSGVGEALLAEDDGLDAEDAGLENLDAEDVGLESVGVGVGGGVADPDVAVGVADGLDVGAGSCSGSHDWWLAAVAAPAAAAARLTPENAVSRTLPVIRATAAGRGCANRMKTPTAAARYCSERLTHYRQSYPLGPEDHGLGRGSRCLRARTGGCPRGGLGINERTVSL